MVSGDELRVLYVVSAAAPPSGAEYVLADYLGGLGRARDSRVLLIGDNPDTSRLFAGVLGSARVHVMGGYRWRGSFLDRTLLMGANVCGARRAFISLTETSSSWLRDMVDVVYFNNSLEAALLYGAFGTRSQLIHIHDMVSMFRRPHARRVLRACRSADAVITVSRAAAEELVAGGVDASKVRVIHNGAPPAQSSVGSGVVGGLVTIGFVGSAIPRKGLDRFVAIVSAFSARRGRARALVVTNSLENQYLRRCLSQLPDSVEVEVQALVPRALMPALYQRMDCLLVPSRRDPLPTVVLEASAMGLPTFGADVDGIPEMINDSRRLLDASDVEACATQIDDWLSLPQGAREASIIAQQAMLETEFSPRRKAELVDELLRQVAGRGL